VLDLTESNCKSLLQQAKKTTTKTKTLTSQKSAVESCMSWATLQSLTFIRRRALFAIDDCMCDCTEALVWFAERTGDCVVSGVSGVSAVSVVSVVCGVDAACVGVRSA
jgi:hypothetical protein